MKNSAGSTHSAISLYRDKQVRRVTEDALKHDDFYHLTCVSVTTSVDFSRMCLYTHTNSRPLAVNTQNCSFQQVIFIPATQNISFISNVKQLLKTIFNRDDWNSGRAQSTRTCHRYWKLEKKHLEIKNVTLNLSNISSTLLYGSWMLNTNILQALIHVDIATYLFLDLHAAESPTLGSLQESVFYNLTLNASV